MSKAYQIPPSSIHLRDVEPADLTTLFLHQSDEDASHMAAVNARDAEAFYAHWAKILGDRSTVAKAILADGVVVGNISCFEMEGENCVGYWVAKEHWGRGIATRALALLLEQVSIRPLHAIAASHNLGSIRVLERCGFVITGRRASPATERFRECEEVMLVLR